MRRYGDIGGVYFIRQGYSIYSLAYEYKLTHNGEASTVYVNNMTELREEISKLAGDYIDDQQARISSAHQYRG